MLALLLAEHGDELEADFQEFYGLNLEDMGKAYSVRHAAVLAANLPAQARCLKSINHDLDWSLETHMLSVIEYDLRCLMWSLSDAKKKHIPYPKQLKPHKEKKIKEVKLSDMERIEGILNVRR